MGRYHVLRGLRAANVSRFEEHSFLAGILLIVAAVPAGMIADDRGATARVIALVGLGALTTCAVSHGLRLYRAGVAASLPTSVARVRVRVRPARGFAAATVGLALVLPFAAAVAVLAVVPWSWMLVASMVLIGCAGMFVSPVREVGGERPYSMSSAVASGLLERLCMRADMRVPELVVEHDAVANSWTAGGRIHVTTPLLDLLDEAELEGVLAHEVAHLARRDAAVMEICSAPSRMLLAFAEVTVRWTRKLLAWGMLRTSVAMGILTVLCGPPAFVIGWISRLSVLGMSRARELSADGAAATLTGRPSALASALLKLDREREWIPRSDLRQVEAFAVLCIVGAGRARLGRLFSTHPRTADRVRRLQEIELQIQSGPYS